MNPYTVVRQVFQTPEAIADLLNKKFNEGFHPVQMWNGPGEVTNIAFIFKPKGAAQQNF
jgi:hypothetical protein